MKRCSSVPVNVKNRSLKRTDSKGNVIRVIPAIPQPSVASSSQDDSSITEIGITFCLTLNILFSWTFFKKNQFKFHIWYTINEQKS